MSHNCNDEIMQFLKYIKEGVTDNGLLINKKIHLIWGEGGGEGGLFHVFYCNVFCYIRQNITYLHTILDMYTWEAFTWMDITRYINLSYEQDILKYLFDLNLFYSQLGLHILVKTRGVTTVTFYNTYMSALNTSAKNIIKFKHLQYHLCFRNLTCCVHTFL